MVSLILPPLILAAIILGGASIFTGGMGALFQGARAKKYEKKYEGRLDEANISLQQSIDWRKQAYAQAGKLIFGENSMFGSQSSIFGTSGSYWATPKSTKGENPVQGFFKEHQDDTVKESWNLLKQGWGK